VSRSHFVPWRLLAGALLAGALAPAALAVATSAPAAAGTPRCSAGSLDVWLAPTENGTAGTIYYELDFTNFSGLRCTLQGYPGVTARAFAGGQLGSPARHFGGAAPLVTLAPGATATASLGIVEAGNFPSSACHEVTAAALSAALPAGGSRLVPDVFQACSHAGPSYLTIAPFHHQ